MCGLFGQQLYAPEGGEVGGDEAGEGEAELLAALGRNGGVG